MRLKGIKTVIVWVLVLSLMLTAVPITVIQAAGTPTITAISPNSGMQDTTNNFFNIFGSNFVAPTTIIFSGTGVTASNVSVDSDGILSATLIIDPTAAPGARNVTISNANGSVTSSPPAGGFTVLAAALPTINSLSVTQGIPGGVYKGVVITGTNFLNTTTLEFPGSGTPGITFSNIVVNSATQATATVTVPSGTPLRLTSDKVSVLTVPAAPTACILILAR